MQDGLPPALLKKEVIVAGSPSAPLRLAFPAKLAASMDAGLFPDKVNLYAYFSSCYLHGFFRSLL